MWRVLIVEDDLLTREFFAASVAHNPTLSLVGAVGTVAQACHWLHNNAGGLDVLLTDLGLPDGSGLDVIRKAVALNPACEPLVISMFGDDDSVLASIEAGALGYIHKDATPDDISKTILDMRNGESPISPMIARRVLAKYRFFKTISAVSPVDNAQAAINSIATHNPSDGEQRSILSPREQEVLSLIARGFSYAEIARLQDLSVHTVQTHIKRLYAKLSVHSKSEAVFEATRMGLLSHHD
jgi:DNA-binding NarL/FixJ family response regulator